MSMNMKSKKKNCGAKKDKKSDFTKHNPSQKSILHFFNPVVCQKRTKLDKSSEIQSNLALLNSPVKKPTTDLKPLTGKFTHNRIEIRENHFTYFIIEFDLSPSWVWVYICIQFSIIYIDWTGLMWKHVWIKSNFLAFLQILYFYFNFLLFWKYFFKNYFKFNILIDFLPQYFI